MLIAGDKDSMMLEIARSLTAGIGQNISWPKKFQDFNSHRADYTREVFRILSDLGCRHGFKSFADTYSEWATRWVRPQPFDFTWMNEQDEALVVESEWLYKPDRIMEDFRKLLASKSALKLMIHARTDDAPVLNGVIDSLIANTYRSKVGDVYGLIQITDLRGSLSLNEYSICVKEVQGRTHKFVKSLPRVTIPWKHKAHHD